MKADQKKRLIVMGGIAIIAIIIIAICVMGGKEKNTPNSNVKTGEGNTLEMTTEDKKYAGLEFTDLNLVNKEGTTTVTATVKNNNPTESKSQYVKINVLDQNKNVITNITGIVAAIPAGGTTTLNAIITENCDNARDLEITAINK
ncbi:MAG: hypothetical protein HFJ54_06755 [Clostridia bacterium]|nr:hypothetical protein [Clostridia bacterium]